VGRKAGRAAVIGGKKCNLSASSRSRSCATAVAQTRSNPLCKTSLIQILDQEVMLIDWSPKERVGVEGSAPWARRVAGCWEEYSTVTVAEWRGPPDVGVGLGDRWDDALRTRSCVFSPSTSARP
jgi:hypothetical protein